MTWNLSTVQITCIASNHYSKGQGSSSLTGETNSLIQLYAQILVRQGSTANKWDCVEEIDKSLIESPKCTIMDVDYIPHHYIPSIHFINKFILLNMLTMTGSLMKIMTWHLMTKHPSQGTKSAEHSLDQQHHHLILWQAPYTIIKLKTCSWEDFYATKHN